MTSAIIICFLFTLFTILTINSYQSTKTETLMSLTQATDIAINQIELDNHANTENYNQVVGDMLKNIILLSDTTGEVNVKILEANTEEGLLDIQVTKTYKWFGLKRNVSVKRTVIMEEFENPPQKPVTAYFVFEDTDGEEAIVREEITFENAIIKRPKNPKKKNFTFVGWSLVENGTTISDDEWQNFLVPAPDANGEVKFYAIFQPNT